jgi:hypothetical protein
MTRMSPHSHFTGALGEALLGPLKHRLIDVHSDDVRQTF